MSKSLQAKPPTTASSADWSDVAEIQKQLSDTAERIAAMTNAVGKAKHIIEYDSDRRKRALAKVMARSIESGEGVGAAEAAGRASNAYKVEMATLGQEHQSAATILAEFEALKLRWETARSLLAMTREQIRM